MIKANSSSPKNLDTIQRSLAWRLGLTRRGQVRLPPFVPGDWDFIDPGSA